MPNGLAFSFGVLCGMAAFVVTRKCIVKAEKIASRVFRCRLSIKISIQFLKNVPYRTKPRNHILKESPGVSNIKRNKMFISEYNVL